MAGARWPGRLQRVAGRPPLLLDGAHNPAGARALAVALQGEPPFVLVFGVMADKDVEALGATLFPLARHVIVTRAPGARAATPGEIARRAGGQTRALSREPSPGRALQRARRIAGAQGLVVVAGSLYLIGDVLRRLEARPTRRARTSAARGGRRAAARRRPRRGPARG
jgi:dihydrofolate synthase/folylpolyglutamate synthase